jgi:hypothetical protein
LSENSISRSVGPDEVEKEFAETLRQAAFVFENEENGRFQGSILACRAVARFIHQRGGGAELAAPFLQIATAFEDLGRGGKPRLFSKKSVAPKERERSPERKHIHMLAAAALEVLVQLSSHTSSPLTEDMQKKTDAANKVARHVNKWPGMGAQQVTGRTVIGWRNEQRRLTKDARKPFERVVERILAEPAPRKTVEWLLRSGPPGLFKD